MAGFDKIVEWAFKGNPNDLIGAFTKIKKGFAEVGKESEKSEQQVSGSFSRAASHLDAAGRKMTTIGKTLTVGVTGPMIYALKQMTDAAVEDQAAVANLEGQLKRTTGATRKQLDEVNKYIDATSMATAVADDQLRPAFERLARTSGSIKTAQQELNIAIDVARGSGKDLDSITQAIAKGNIGSMTALGKLGISTKDANGNLKSMSQILDDLNAKFGGASKDYLNTAAGRAEQAKIKFNELKESIGYNLIPVMEQLATMVSKAVDAFTSLPDWAQQSAIALFALKGPIMWLGGEGLKLIANHILKQRALKIATEEVGDAMGRHGVEGGSKFGAGISRGAHDAQSAMSGFKTFMGGVGITAVVVAMVASIEQAIDGMSKLWAAVDSSGGSALKRSETAAASWGSTWMRYLDNVGRYLPNFGPVFGTFADNMKKGLDPKNSQKFLDLLDKAREKGGSFADAAEAIAKKNISAKEGIRQLNDVLNGTDFEAKTAILSKTADGIATLGANAAGSKDDLIDLKGAMDALLQPFMDQEQAQIALYNAQKSFGELSKQVLEDKKLDTDETYKMRESLMQYVQAYTNEYQVALDKGQITEQQAADKKKAMIDQLEGMKQKFPELTPTIQGYIDRLRGIPTSIVSKLMVTGVDESIRGADRLAQALKNIGNEAANAGRAMSSVATLGPMRPREAGGTMGFARGGFYQQNSGGGITNGITYVVGEGRNPREYVIPTDPQYSRRAQTLLGMASAELGVPRQQVSSTFAPVINVTGGSDPQGTAEAVADAVEQIFARKVRRQGSLAFS